MEVVVASQKRYESARPVEDSTSSPSGLAETVQDATEPPPGAFERRGGTTGYSAEKFH